jgi:nitroimidazol reductase NimA-like FMN-containing flavoprotein (pyridoxamine 5'-phosphate oxidase superfamily)
VLNVRRNPKVGLMVETGDSYAELRGVMVRGHCEIIEDPKAVAAAFAFRAEARDNRAPMPGAVASAPKRVVLKVLPHRVMSWDHRKLSGGY